MLNLKKTAIAVLAFGSSAVFAGTMGPVCAPGAVTVPCESTAWDFGAQALYLKPSYNGLGQFGLGAASTSTAAVGTPSTTTGFYDNANNAGNWGWGFKLEGSYHFRTGNDLNLNWYHLGTTQNRSDVFAVGAYRSSFPTVVGGNAVDPNQGASQLKTKWDAVNLEFGQLAHFGELENIRFHGGVQYAYINPSVNAALRNSTTTAFELQDASLKYNGFGPRVGADFAYGWGNGLGMYANTASALLVGTQKFAQTTYNQAAGGAKVIGYVNGSSTQIVPDLEAKLGVTYTYAMAQGDLSLDVGWMWVNYFNALAYQSQGSATVGTAGSLAGNTTNFGVQGLLFGLKWVGNVV